MPGSEDKFVFTCPECGSRAFEIHDLRTTEGAFVSCAECWAEVGQLDEFMMIIETPTEVLEQRKRRSN